MALNPIRPRPFNRPPRSSGPVLAVGQRAFVHCPTDRPGSVVLTDERGDPQASDLGDGAEVEVLAWLPRGSAGARYRVRARHDGADGWLAADQLRTMAARPAPASPPAATGSAPAVDPQGRGFGARR